METPGKKEQRFSLKRGENLVYAAVWVVVFLMPVLLFKNSGNIIWERVLREWLRIFPLFVIFMIHNWILFPLYSGNKKWYYLLFSLVVILGVSFAGDWFTRFILQAPSPYGNGQVHRLPDIPLPGHEVFSRPWHLVLLGNFIISVLVVGFNAAIKTTVKWQEETQKNKDLEKQKLQAELAFLRNQVSPHFFMNTLNNIHALIDINSEDAKDALIKLSKMMRYMLYDTEAGKTTLKKEIEFIRNYVDLMKLRFTGDVKIGLEFPEIIPDTTIPPMIFISLVENAFKHGISYQAESFVGIYLKISEGILFFRSVNSNHKTENGQGGIGLKNLRKRLELIYGNDFSFDYGLKDGKFDTLVKLPLNEN